MFGKLKKLFEHVQILALEIELLQRDVAELKAKKKAAVKKPVVKKTK